MGINKVTTPSSLPINTVYTYLVLIRCVGKFQDRGHAYTNKTNSETQDRGTVLHKQHTREIKSSFDQLSYGCTCQLALATHLVILLRRLSNTVKHLGPDLWADVYYNSNHVITGRIVSILTIITDLKLFEFPQIAECLDILIGVAMLVKLASLFIIFLYMSCGSGLGIDYPIIRLELNFSITAQNICASAETCDECLRIAPDCVWCSQVVSSCILTV